MITPGGVASKVLDVGCYVAGYAVARMAQGVWSVAGRTRNVWHSWL